MGSSRSTGRKRISCCVCHAALSTTYSHSFHLFQVLDLIAGCTDLAKLHIVDFGSTDPHLIFTWALALRKKVPDSLQNIHICTNSVELHVAREAGEGTVSMLRRLAGQAYVNW